MSPALEVTILGCGSSAGVPRADGDWGQCDPANPKMFLPAYDSCDHLHPNQAGMQAMGEAIDLALLRATGTRR